MDPLSSQVAVVRQSSRELVRQLGFLEDQVFDLGISHSQCHVLLELDQQGHLSLQELCAVLKVEKSTLSRTVSSLIKRGLIQAHVSKFDKRRKPLEITEAGRAL